MSGTLLRFVRFVDRCVRTRSGAELGIHELSILGNIDRGAALPSVLARTLQIDPARITRTVDHLVSLGYVERGADPSDRRRSPLALTDHGRERLRSGRHAVMEAVASITERLAPEKEDFLFEVLDDVRDVLEDLGSGFRSS